MRAVGEHLWGDEFDERWMQIANGFGGGVAGTHAHLCGALSGGLIVLGLRYGRTSASTPDDPLYGRIRRFRQRFADEIGGVMCRALRDKGPYGPQGPLNCRILVERATMILLECLDASSG